MGLNPMFTLCDWIPCSWIWEYGNELYDIQREHGIHVHIASCCVHRQIPCTWIPCSRCMSYNSFPYSNSHEWVIWHTCCVNLAMYTTWGNMYVNPMFTLWSIHTHWRVKYVTSHVPMGHVAHRNHVTHSLAWLTRLRHAHTYMHKHTCTTTDTYTDESHHTYSWVIESVRHDSFRVCDMTQQPFANRSSGAWVMSDIATSHVTSGNESYHT